MKGKIDKYGNLYIERGDKMKSQSCPFKEKSEHDYFENCNDECPLFGEPTQLSHTPSGDTYGIKLCKRELVFEELIDERSDDGKD